VNRAARISIVRCSTGVAGPCAVVLGGVNTAGNGVGRDVYHILLEESNSTLPALLSQLGGPAAQREQSCPSWVHAQYVTMGPAGKFYLAWHPQIDQVWWCCFGHEHGSNPDLSLLGYSRPWGVQMDRWVCTPKH
jgi:hypothetical protein